MTEQQAIEFACTSVGLYYLECKLWTYTVRRCMIHSIASEHQTIPMFIIKDAETMGLKEIHACELFQTEEEAEKAKIENQKLCDEKFNNIGKGLPMLEVAKRFERLRVQL